MANIFSQKVYDAYDSAFKHAIKGDLQKNYFIHNLDSPYDRDSNNIIKTLKDQELDKINKLFDKIKKQLMNKRSWSAKEAQQIKKLLLWGEAILESLPPEFQQNNAPTDLLGVTQWFNKLYQSYITQKTNIYQQDGYLHRFFVLALNSIVSKFKTNFPGIVKECLGKDYQLKRWFWDSTDKNIDNFYSFVDNNKRMTSFIKYIDSFDTVRDTKKSLYHLAMEQFITGCLNDLKNNPPKSSSAKQIYEFEKAILDFLNKNLDTNYFNSPIIQTTISHQGLVSKRLGEKSSNDKSLGTKIGYGNEDIKEVLIKEILDKSRFNYKLKNTGAKKESFQLWDVGEEVYYEKTYTVTTDIFFSIQDNASSKLSTKMTSNRDKIIQAANSSGSEEQFRISEKNYDLKHQASLSEDDFLSGVSARSAGNLSAYGARLMDQFSKYSKEIEKNIVKNQNFHYLLLNESVKGRDTKFREDVMGSFSQMGFAVLINFNKIDDEIDFVDINNNIIPTALIYQQLTSNEAIKGFKMQLKSSTTPTVKSSDLTKKTVNAYLYDNNFLSKNRQVGIKQFKDFRFDTKMTYNFVERLLQKIKGGI